MSGITPVAEIVFALRAYGGLDRLIASGAFPDLDGETASAIIEEASRFAEDQLLPLNQPGDRTGVTLADGVVTTPPGWKETYRRWSEAGWNGIGSPPEWGGQGLPVVLQMALQEIWNAGQRRLRRRPDAERRRRPGARRPTPAKTSRSAICPSSSPANGW